MTDLKGGREVVKNYFKYNTIIQSQVDSYNYFIEEGFKKVILEYGVENIPDYLTETFEKINFKIKDTWLGEPEYVEADGSKSKITPNIARLRGVTYSAPLYLSIETKIEGKKEKFDIQIAKMPIMLKSEKCILKNMNFDELIKAGEDPYEPGGYFIVNGTEKVVVMIEDLALNKLFLEKQLKRDVPVGRLFSERGVYKSLQEVNKLKDGTYTYSFGNFKNLPLFLLIKALGIENDKQIIENTNIMDADIIFQMSEFSNVTQEEAFEILSKKFNLFGSTKEKTQRISFYLNNFVLPHLGIQEENRIDKAKVICKFFKIYYNRINKTKQIEEDKDHYGTKRIKLVGKLFEQLFMTSFNDLIVDLLTNFQRMVKRNKFSSMKIVVREQLLTQKLHSALALGVWSDGRKGVVQYLKRENYFDMVSHLTRIISPLSSSQENFLARELHSTQYGRLCPIETPEGGSIGLRKNKTLLSEVTFKQVDLDENFTTLLQGFGLEEDSTEESDYAVFLNDKYIGGVKNKDSFISKFIEKRRENKINSLLNIGSSEVNKMITIESSLGRLRRPLIVVKNGKSTFTEKIISELKEDKINYSQLLEKGIIEYIDALEEDFLYVAGTEKEITNEHTHVEILPALFFGLNTGSVPFPEFDDPGRLIRGQKTLKQAIGTYSLNSQLRKETDRNNLVSPQKPLVKTFFYDVLELGEHPAGQNMTVALMSYEGYNMEDGIILNQSSIQRGMQRSFYYKLHNSKETKYPGGSTDRISKPSTEVKNFRLEEDYRLIEEDGIIRVGEKVSRGDVIIGKTSPPRFSEEQQGFGQMINQDIDSSLALKEDEKGIASKVFLIENNGGNKEVSVILRDQRLPIVGDKFASRHGQKGVVGAIFKESDLPFTESGIIPDIITSPHSIPGRKTVSHVMEILAGKVAALRGNPIDGTSFDGEKEEDLRNELEKLGFDNKGVEVMYDPKTGKKINAQIYVGNIYYLRLKHQVENKLQARGTGPVQLLTRQPAEGKNRGGGLKLGEMEKDTLISHGASLLLKERFSSDQTKSYICQGCGKMLDVNIYNYKSKCPYCNSSRFDKIEISYAFKLFLNELKSMGIVTGFETKDRFFDDSSEENKEETNKNEVEE